ncbi:hypothetical protein ABH15_12160 [Methanoculleus taiwanensis]|uniref:Glycerophosphoryl diester phosphodiesterase membrane domain-containing protein n=1 Tax=Methanoculleus taiwanensis TaxID=1550565 RepID=A0A498GZB4_9EURY|nr:hypothetical protein [Methanoculleus taiwanensis]RXE55477.1 hypothetical protein ABH15_12160 [Methanoculleus taiwanensis]
MADDTYAFDELEGTLNRTKNLLWPINWAIWFRLAVITLFVGGGFSFPNVFQYNFPGDDYGAPMAGGFDGFAPLFFGVIALVLILALFFMFVSATVQFVFVESLASRSFRLAPLFSKHLGKGARLFAFQLALSVLMLLAMAAIFLVIFAPMVLGGGSIGVSFSLLLLVLIPAAILVALIFGLVIQLTVDFVVPIMLHDDCGVISGWRHLWPAVSSQVLQTVVYIVVKLILAVLAAIVEAILIILALIVIAIPFALIGIALIALGVQNIAIFLILLIPYLIIAIPAALLIQVPFVTFLRYYSLLVLGRLAPRYTLLA